MNIFRRPQPQPERLPAPVLSAFWSRAGGRVTPLDNTASNLSPEPGVPLGSVGMVCDERFDPCGAPAIGSKKGSQR